MIEIILDKHILFVLMGSIAFLGIISKFIVSITLKRLVRAAGNMNKSNHPLMRLVRAKFEHTCMISEKVENVRVFVDKYLYEYRAAGMKLHSWRRMELAAAGLCLLIGILGGVLEYSINGMQDMVLRTGAAGAGLAILVFLVHLTTDEGYRLEAVRNYMVDYLENICLHRYEKAYQKEIKVMSPEAPVSDYSGAADREKEEHIRVQRREAERELFEEHDVLDVSLKAEDRDRATEHRNSNQEPMRPHPGREVPSPRTDPEITPPVMPEPYDVPDVTPPVRGIMPGAEAVSSARSTGGAGEVFSPVRSTMQGGESVPSSVWGAVPEETTRMSALSADVQKEGAAEAPGTAAATLNRAVEAAKTERRLKEREGKKEQAKETAKDLLIRQILEEFMA